MRSPGDEPELIFKPQSNVSRIAAWFVIATVVAFTVACDGQPRGPGQPETPVAIQVSTPAINIPNGPQRANANAPDQLVISSDAASESLAPVASSRDRPGGSDELDVPADSGIPPTADNQMPAEIEKPPDAPDPQILAGADRCRDLADRGRELTDSLSAEMGDFESDWGFALIDIACQSEISANAGHSQYPASAGKIVIVIAALRAVSDGHLESDASLMRDIEGILVSSLGQPADRLVEQLSPEQIAAVQERAGVSIRSKLTNTWRHAYFTPVDLARVWASLLLGDQLDAEFTDLVLEMTGRARLPDEDGFWPFPADFGSDGVQYGQKAGFWESEEPIGYRISAGYLREAERSGEGFAFAFLARISEEGLDGDWRRPVFPLVRDFIESEIEFSQ